MNERIKRPTKRKLLRESKVFCSLPWNHLHVWPNRDVFPCCFATDRPLGKLGASFGLKEHWNSEPLRELRRDMLAGKPNPRCRRCYEAEERQSVSARQSANVAYGEKHWDKILDTHPDGSLDEMRLALLDFRFSNLCNFRCRTCGPELSSSWFEDNNALHVHAKTNSKVIRLNPGGVELSEIEKFLPDVEEIYFAGGEPLIADEHYQILDLLIARKRTDVRLRYSSNFSRLTHGHWDVTKLWREFASVQLMASVDGSGARGEYIRKGQRWDQILQNRERLMRESPNVQFWVVSTVSVLNALHIPDFHQEWLENGFLEPGRFLINPVTEPECYSAQVLPASLKNDLKLKYFSHAHLYLRNLKKTPNPRFFSDMTQFLSLIRFVEASDQTHQLPRLRELTRGLDQLRAESFESVFPELKGLLD